MLAKVCIQSSRISGFKDQAGGFDNEEYFPRNRLAGLSVWSWDLFRRVQRSRDTCHCQTIAHATERRPPGQAEEHM